MLFLALLVVSLALVSRWAGIQMPGLVVLPGLAVALGITLLGGALWRRLENDCS